ncbi:transporter substrate-binding domain-containing protein [Dasania sp. GY-MA-18]|uniref:Transporter substrate-binding domain-containing protein n=1 Tax=Dasania phycosphaerae TaxID=2950436 RepID=A0A9J6RL06_9GAMM|nr:MULTISPECIES: transporter substrate-binding domain-containing protein [Dasania]MCR8922967.1 transporter substrate-binding domain-containing protein [Dasania sp. GY-MA-18]MCZ0865398.1 transporter substrate-binding domain-containing protein [Dasania phycosphaerae]MCZ0869123.1 transporter substrate-binding domain-containing protein [Dasania phycosphaerae]
MRFPLILLLLLSHFSVAQPVSIRADEWFPMNGKPGAELPGYMIELAQRAFGSIDYKLMPWSRALEEVRSGRVDCVVGADVRDVPGFVLPHENWGTTQIGIYRLKEESWSYQGFESLLSQKVGVVKDYTYGEPMDSQIPMYPKVFKIAAGEDGLSRNIKQLMSKRLDAFIASTAVANTLIKQMGLEDRISNIAVLGRPLVMYIACSPANERSFQLIDQVDQATRRLRASGELELILNKYGLSDWQQ